MRSVQGGTRVLGLVLVVVQVVCFAKNMRFLRPYALRSDSKKVGYLHVFKKNPECMGTFVPAYPSSWVQMDQDTRVPGYVHTRDLPMCRIQ